MRVRIITGLAAVVAALAFAASGAATTPIQYNVDSGGGGCTNCSYIARVYVYYNGYWHWMNCEYLIFSWGTVLNKCW